VERAEPTLGQPDLTKDKTKFLAAIRGRIFAFLASWAGGQWEEAVDALDAFARREPEDREGKPWTAERLEESMAQYTVDHHGPMLNPEGRNLRHTYAKPKQGDENILAIQQMLVDEDAANDWVAEFEVDLETSREYSEPIMDMVYLGLFR